MKKSFLLLSVLICMSCAGQEKKSADTQNAELKNINDMNFEELFTGISAEEISDNIFRLVGKDITVITSGNESNFNSMAASWGGAGILFNKPASWCMLRANRYTLEIIKREHTYTLSYFPDEYREQVLFFGSKSGRNTDKMKETTLTPVQTPDGNTTYREARLVLECKLIEVTTVHPDDFTNQENRDFILDGFNEAKEYHKLVFGEITGVWIKKDL
ncbi:MAG: flavin reductase [Prevotellaceae bacterium]|jgi:flavin reductase (DIM6/NTAB) family NADH-FMN oxidoreductase RutF|nr:flavin reductase [Prevotellaceae bacterium]